MNGDPDEAFIATRGRYLAIRNGLAVILAILLLGVLALQTFLAIQDNQRIKQNEEIQTFIRQQAITNGALGKQNAKTVKLIRSCVTPGGTCYQQGQRRTAAAVVGINEGTLRVVAAALSCEADGLTEERALARCTVDRAQPEEQP